VLFELWKEYFTDLLDQTAAAYAEGATLVEAVLASLRRGSSRRTRRISA